MKKALISAFFGLGLLLNQAIAAPPVSECIAPANQGGGWDFTCRSVTKILNDEDYAPHNIHVYNVYGAGGGVAYSHVATKRQRDPTLFVAASTATTTRLAQNKYPGMTADMVRWAGALGADYGIIAVNKNSEFNNINDLINSVKKDSRSVKFAGASSTGGWDHLKVLMLAKDGGISNLRGIRYSSFNSGGDAIAEVVEGNFNAFSGDISEVTDLLRSGDIKVLAVLADERLPAPFDDIPTAKEQGISTLAPNWRGFYVPSAISDKDYQWWTETLQAISTSQAWQKVMQENGLMPFAKFGDDFNAYVSQQISDIRDISAELGIQ